MNRFAAIWCSLISTLGFSCSSEDKFDGELTDDSSASESSLTISGLREDGTPYATCYVSMKALADELLTCFPGFDMPPVESLPSELPHAYTYRVEIKRPDGEFELLVYHQDARIFPGLWRHPDGTHLYFEDAAPERFLELAEICGVRQPGANKTTDSTR